MVLKFKGSRLSFFGIVCTMMIVWGAMPLAAQKRAQDVYVDKNGVMRWGDSREEVKGFGINYTAMFAHAYRTAKRMNIDLEQALDNDIYHFARLGFDAFRVHVWDTEISDTLGNLLENDHLRLFDYALSKMKARGMKFVITPIAYWGNGWPERDENTPGFSHKYGKDACLTNPDAIKAQERYLYQFLNHVNRYTNIAFKDDPSIIAFEVCNEPHHHEAPQKVTAFINGMVKAMRNTGCRKPVFYNISHSIHLADAYFNSDIQGGTFQWYPTGLGAGHELRGNLLPNVDRYEIPFAGNPKFKKIAKFVYEFDAADVGRSYIYPAIARSFRRAGMQVATHFSYDPAFMADVNTEYGTHYMNLAYAPQKALSLMIAAEVFHTVPMYKDYGSYPQDTLFGDFRVSYKRDLAEIVGDTKFVYTNATFSVPPHPDRLESIAGFGHSPIIKYDGAGAYFLDRLQSGVWRLEVMPDAIWLDDPFKKTSPKKKVAAIAWREWPASVSLPDLGDSFTIKGINDGNAYNRRTSDGSFKISPGTYLLTKEGVQADIDPGKRWKNIILNEFVAPRPSLDGICVRHQPVDDVPAGAPYRVVAFVASPDSLQSVEVFAWTPGEFRPRVFTMDATGSYHFEATIPGELLKEGFLKYHIVIRRDGLSYTYPSGLQTHPYDWDFYDSDPYSVAVLPVSAPLVLFDPLRDAAQLSRPWVRSSSVGPWGQRGQAELTVNVEDLSKVDPETRATGPIRDYSMRLFIGDKIEANNPALGSKTKIVLRARSLNVKSCPFQIALVTARATAFGGIVSVGSELQTYELRLSDLKEVRLVTFPRPYPTFLPYYFHRGGAEAFDMSKVEVLQLSIGPGISEQEAREPQGISIESIVLE
jgi:hypothetical protein